MKPIKFLGDSLEAIRDFPDDARHDSGFQLDRLQRGLEPIDWKPMRGIGVGVKELRVKVSEGAFRVIYVAKFADFIYVLHAFQKKTEKTEKADINLAKERYREVGI